MDDVVCYILQYVIVIKTNNSINILIYKFIKLYASEYYSLLVDNTY